MKQIGKYWYADSGKSFVMTLAGMESSDVRRAFSQLDNPANGLGKVPASWVTHGWVTEAVK